MERTAAPSRAAGVRLLTDDTRRLLGAWTRGWCGSACTPLVLSLVVALSALAGEPMLRATAGPLPAQVAHLLLPRGYVAGAPFFELLEAMTLLSIRQHVALLITVAVVFATWRAVRPSTRSGQSILRRAARELLAALAAFAVVAGVYAAGAFLPRPIPRLTIDRSHPDLAVIDFHSHTNHSWDGRPDFTVERNREWHSRAGFDIAYVTDHAHVTPVDAPPTEMARSEEAAPDAGVDPERTRLLPGIELRYAGQHVVLLGAQADDSAAYASGNLHPRRLALLEQRTARRIARTTTPEANDDPVMLLTSPGNPDFARTHPEVLGVELFDATPRALGESAAYRRRLADLADSLHIARVASSNNHGLAHEAGAWSVMRIPGWRAMNVVELDQAIRATLRASRNDAVTVIERRRVASGGAVALAITVPSLLLDVLRTMTWPERLSSLAWTWAIWGLLMLVRRGRRKACPVPTPG